MNIEQNAAPAGDTAPEPVTFESALDTLNAQDAPEITADQTPSADEPEVEEADTAEAPEAEAPSEPDEADEVLHGNAKTRLRDGTVVAIADLKKAFDEAKEYRAKQSEHEAAAKEFETKRAQIAAQEQFFTQTIQHAKALLERSMPPEPDASLRESDPIEFFLQKDKRESAVLEWRRLDHAQKVQAQNAEREHAEQTKAMIAQEMDLLKEAVPELKTEDGFKAFKEDILTHAPKEYGFTPKELGELSDHRALRVLKDAIAYRKLQAKKPAALEKVAKAPPVAVAPPGRRQGADEAKAGQVKSRMDAARANGGMSLDDAHALLNSFES
jgi:hypothetical protein